MLIGLPYLENKFIKIMINRRYQTNNILYLYLSKGNNLHFFFTKLIPGRVAQSVTCLATDTSLTADPGVGSSIPFVEIDHEINSTVILLPHADSFKKVCCQLQAKVCA